MDKISNDILNTFKDPKWPFWKAITKITERAGLSDKEITRESLRILVIDGYLTTKPSDLSNDAPGTLKYRLTEKGRDYLGMKKIDLF